MDALPGSPILVEQVYNRLVGAITDWTLRPGQRILQADLANSLGVSRQPVSHALQILKQQGLVQDAGRKGLEITPIDPARIRQLYEVRAALDALAAGLCASRAAHRQVTRDEEEALLSAAQLGETVGSDITISRLVALDVTFHRAIYDLSGNSAIHEMVAPQWPHLRRSMHAVLEANSFRTRAWTEHKDIARLILVGDVEEAKRAAHGHAINAGTETERRLRSASSN